MTPRDDDSLVLAYVYGELTDDEARAFEQRLAADPGLRAEVEGLVATRAFVDEDARFGERAGVDLPPPHLTDAILRAEALARPTEIRQAHAASGRGGFLARMQLWLVGGGLAVSAAAAFLLVAKDDASPEAPAAEAPAAAEKADAPAAGERQAETLAPNQPVAELEAADGDVVVGGAPVGNTALDEAEVAEPAEAPAAALAAPPPREEPTAGLLSRRDAARGDGAVDKGGAERDDQASAFGAGDAESFAVAQKAAEQKAARPSREKDEKPAAPAGAVATAEGRFDLDDALEERSAPDAKPKAVAKETPAPAKASAPVEQSAPADAPVTTGTGGGGRLGASAPAPGPPPLPEAVRREAAKKRSARSRAPAREQVPSEPGPGRADQLQLTLITAERELQDGRALEALDLFTQVARQDPRGTHTGVVPYVGQMRALYALGRYRDVVALVPTVKRPGIQGTGVPEGILVGARAAEALGDARLARELYRELLVVKPMRKQAEAALARLDAAARARMDAAVDAVEGEAAAEPSSAADE